MPPRQAFPLSPRIILALTLLLCAPALWTGFLGDDYLHYAILGGEFPALPFNDWALFGLFTWVDGDPERNRILMDLGAIPWWTYEGMRYEFWRPLSELSHWLDHRLWHDSPVMMHLHSIVLYVLLGVALHRLYERSGLGPIAGVAALAAFMLDSTHGYTVGWIANRNAILAAIFGVLCLREYMAWREEGDRAAAGRSHLFLALSLFSAEIGISTTAYLGAYALMLDRNGPRQGLVALWSHALLCVVWWTLYKVGQFGANASDINYIDPIESPLIFLSQLIERVPVLLAAQYGIVPAEVYGFAPELVPWYPWSAYLWLALVAWMAWPWLSSSRDARFWALGSVFAVAPVCTTLPWDRNLIMVGIGGAALVGILYSDWRSRLQGRRAAQVVAVGFLGLHLIIAPLLMPLISYTPRVWNTLMGMEKSLQFPLPRADERVLIVGIPLQASLATTAVRHYHGLPVPERTWVLAGEFGRYNFTRLSETEFDLVPEQPMVRGGEELLRTIARHPLTQGHRVVLDGLALEVTEVNAEGRPMRLRLTLAAGELDRTVILTQQGWYVIRLPLPAVGETLLIDAQSPSQAKHQPAR